MVADDQIFPFRLEKIKMPDLSELVKKGTKQKKGKAPRSGGKNRLDDANLSLNAAVQSAMIQRPSRPTPSARPLPVLTVSSFFIMNHQELNFIY